MNEQDEIVISAKHMIHKLKENRPALEKVDWHPSNIGDSLADVCTSIIGSWKFIIFQASFLIFWITMNVYAWMNSWDPFPFVLLNLVLSFQAAFSAPIIMMSQNRQGTIDRKKIDSDYDISVKIQLELELLHEKMDKLRESEIKQLAQSIRDLAAKVDSLNAK